MVIKGSARGGAGSLAAHLQRTDTNERAELRELRGVAAEDLEGALREMEAVASGARSARHFYHASMNTRADELMTPEQWQHSIDRLESELGLTGQPRAVVAHVKEGREHVHIAWSRIDLETMKAISDSHNFRRHEIVARELEREFGHARVQGAHVEREGERPDRTPSHAQMQQAERSGIDPAEAKAQLTQIWNRTDNGKAFSAAIEEQGWLLARGDRRDFVVVDQAGEVHSLARCIEGARAKDIRQRMADLDAANLPGVGQAKEIQLARQRERQEPAPEIARDQKREADNRDDEQQRNPAIGTTSGGMVAQQQEAERRFEKNSAELDAQHQVRFGVLDDLVRQGKRDMQDNPAVDRGRPRGGRER